ncbi:MAG: membrane dipeptidase [Ignavibacteriales bacterium]|nr:membrane dipeptidase [Ignavibacteriales bacterium]
MGFLQKDAFLSLSCFLSIAVAQNPDPLEARAYKLAQEFIIIDTHIDVPYRLRERWEDISQRTEYGEFDFIRAKAGGLNAPFMSIYVPAARENNGAKSVADSLIDMVENFVQRWPLKFALSKSTDDITSQFDEGKVSLCMGMENGSPVEEKLENVRHFYNRGIRYITLTHGKDNHIGDSSYDTTRTWKGLSPFGKQVVAEMNRLGMMVDISHVSDDVFFQVMEISKAPVIASHSSCRAFTPGWQRNISDDMIKELAKNGGVVMINFGRSFLNAEFQKKEIKIWEHFAAHKLQGSEPEAIEFVKKYWAENPPPEITALDVAKHIDYIVKLVGADYVGFGSDFDGVGGSLPVDLKDVSQYPNLIYELLKMGYSDGDIQKICGGNLLRVWSQVEKKARELRNAKK